ncbi:MAG: DMT family transporter [Bacteroidales bacterium]|jgi:drug/metabolite transporter (DMT)-like permease|nr:DMT family transporter [Bacteroidales bacterium]
MSNQKQKLQAGVVGAIAVAFAAILWGLDGVVLTPHLFNLNVIFVVFILHLIPFILMQPVFYKEYVELARHNWKEIGGLFLAALFGGALGTVCIVKALFLVHFNHLSVIVLLQKLQPVFAITLAAIFLKEKLHSKFILWAALALIAGYFLTFEFHLPDFNHDGTLIQASLFALLAAFAFGSSTVLSKYSLNNFKYTTATFFRYGFTTLITLVLVTITWQWGQFAVASPENWLYIMIICMTTGSGAIFLYYYGLRRISAMTSTILELCYPLSAIIFDYVFNKQTLSWIQWIAAAIMLLCILMLNSKKNVKR